MRNAELNLQIDVKLALSMKVWGLGQGVKERGLSRNQLPPPETELILISVESVSIIVVSYLQLMEFYLV